jgi:hypothetical protein
MTYEIRLGGGKVFHIGYLAGILGRLTVIKAPDFAQADDFPHYARAGWGERGTWNLRPIDDYARDVTFKTARLLCRPVAVTERTPGIGFISIEDGERSVHVDVYLSTREFSASGLSAYEDWTRIVAEAKDDPHRDVLLAMKFGAVAPAEVAAFKSGKALTTTDLDLDVRPRATPFPRED